MNHGYFADRLPSGVAWPAPCPRVRPCKRSKVSTAVSFPSPRPSARPSARPPARPPAHSALQFKSIAGRTPLTCQTSRPVVLCACFQRLHQTVSVSFPGTRATKEAGQIRPLLRGLRARSEAPKTLHRQRGHYKAPHGGVVHVTGNPAPSSPPPCQNPTGCSNRLAHFDRPVRHLLVRLVHYNHISHSRTN